MLFIFSRHNFPSIKNLIVPLFLLLSSNLIAGTTKVEICHIPPGNIANAHTIKVSEKAINAHLKHGDSLGACQKIDCPNDCNDNNACTTDTCKPDGTCLNEAVDCDDGEFCTTDSCDAVQGCMNTPNTNSCNDNNSCTSQDTCINGACQGTPDDDCCLSAADCDDNDLCTLDSCNSGTCENVDKVCDDSNECTADACNPKAGFVLQQT